MAKKAKLPKPERGIPLYVNPKSVRDAQSGRFTKRTKRATKGKRS